MIDVPAIFKNKTLDPKALTAFGFAACEKGFTKSFPILDHAYAAVITVFADGTADFRVYDSEGEEYMPAHVYASQGAFVGEIHKACETILTEIADKCYRTEHFRQEQAKRILRFIKDAYHAEPEFLWSSLPECAALRVPEKKPWFAVVGRVPKEKIGIPESDVTEILNLKDAPEAVAARIAEKKACPAYHMNKQHWYTVLLDGSLDDDEIIAWVRTSFDIVND